MRLYIIPGACSLAANIALREAGIRFELSRLDPATGRWPRLDTYRAQIAQRPHVIAALQSEA